MFGFGWYLVVCFNLCCLGCLLVVDLGCVGICGFTCWVGWDCGVDCSLIALGVFVGLILDLLFVELQLFGWCCLSVFVVCL